MLPTMDELLDSLKKCYEGDVMVTQTVFVYKHISSFLDTFSCSARQFVVLILRNPTAVNQKGVFCSYVPHALSSKHHMPLGPRVELHILLGVRPQLDTRW
jgi:hypothetical protein